MMLMTEILKRVDAHPYLATTIILSGIAAITYVGQKAMDSLKAFGENGTALCNVNILPDDNLLQSRNSNCDNDA